MLQLANLFLFHYLLQILSINLTLRTRLIILKLILIHLYMRRKPNIKLNMIILRQRMCLEPVFRLGVQVLQRNVEHVASMTSCELYGLEEWIWVALSTERS